MIKPKERNLKKKERKKGILDQMIGIDCDVVTYSFKPMIKYKKKRIRQKEKWIQIQTHACYWIDNSAIGSIFWCMFNNDINKKKNEKEEMIIIR